MLLAGFVHHENSLAVKFGSRRGALRRTQVNERDSAGPGVYAGTRR